MTHAARPPWKFDAIAGPEAFPIEPSSHRPARRGQVKHVARRIYSKRSTMAPSSVPGRHSDADRLSTDGFGTENQRTFTTWREATWQAQIPPGWRFLSMQTTPQHRWQKNFLRRSPSSGPPRSSGRSVTGPRRTWSGGRLTFTAMPSNPSSSSPIRRERTRLTRRSSSMRWTCCTQATSTASAWYPATVISRALQHAYGRLARSCTGWASGRHRSPSSRRATSSSSSRF